MDRETRLTLECEMPPAKFGFSATNLFKARIDRAGGPPDAPITDGLEGFAKGHGGATLKRGHPSARHIRDVAMRYRHAGNQICERLNGDIRKATGRARGFYSTNPALLGLWTVYHNFMKSREGLAGAAPAGAAGITVRADGKWPAPIQNAAIL